MFLQITHNIDNVDISDIFVNIACQSRRDYQSCTKHIIFLIRNS